MQARYAVTVDLGSSVTSLCVATITIEGMQVIYYGSKKSRGIARGQVNNPTLCAEVVTKLIEEAEDALNISIDKIAVALPRYPMKQKNFTTSVEIDSSTGYVQETDIENLQEKANDEFAGQLKENQVIYGSVAQSYNTADNFQVSREEVVGMITDSLEGNFNIFYGPTVALGNLRSMLNLIKNRESIMFFIPEQQGMVILSDEERESGTALVEIGGGLTTVSIWKNSVLRSFSSFPFAGRSITTDIKNVCSFKEELAENIKLAYGSCRQDTLQNMTEKVLEILDENTGDRETLTLTTLADIIGSRMNEIAQTAMFLICRSNYDDRLRGGIVLCGGAAQTLGCAKHFKELSGMSVRHGLPRNSIIDCSDFPQLEDMQGASHSALLSLCYKEKGLNCGAQRKQVLFGDSSQSDNTAQTPMDQSEENEVTMGNLDWNVQPEKPSRRQKPQKQPKPAREHNVVINSIFSEVKEVVGNLFEVVYDGMDEQQTEQE